jgi:hypothetical protein
LSSAFDIQLGTHFESVARWWINNKNGALNIFSSAILWSISSLRNEHHFQGKSWLGLAII